MWTFLPVHKKYAAYIGQSDTTWKNDQPDICDNWQILMGLGLLSNISVKLLDKILQNDSLFMALG